MLRRKRSKKGAGLQRISINDIALGFWRARTSAGRFDVRAYGKGWQVVPSQEKSSSYVNGEVERNDRSAPSLFISNVQKSLILPSPSAISHQPSAMICSPNPKKNLSIYNCRIHRSCWGSITIARPSLPLSLPELPLTTSQPSTAQCLEPPPLTTKHPPDKPHYSSYASPPPLPSSTPHLSPQR